MKSLSPRGKKSCNSSSKSTKCLMAGGITMSHSSWGKRIPLTWYMPDESFIVQHSLSYILEINVLVLGGGFFFLHPKSSCTPWQISRINHSLSMYVCVSPSLSLPLSPSLPLSLFLSISLSLPSSPPTTMFKEQVLRGQRCSLFPKTASSHVLSQRRKKIKIEFWTRKFKL